MEGCLVCGEEVDDGVVSEEEEENLRTDFLKGILNGVGQDKNLDNYLGVEGDGHLKIMCGVCRELVVKAVGLNRGQREVEKKVVELQKQVLAELKRLEKSVGEYLEVMGNIGGRLEGNKRQEKCGERRRLMTRNRRRTRRSIGDDEANSFGKIVKKGIDELTRWRTQLQIKTGGVGVLFSEPAPEPEQLPASDSEDEVDATETCGDVELKPELSSDSETEAPENTDKVKNSDPDYSDNDANNASPAPESDSSSDDELIVDRDTTWNRKCSRKGGSKSETDFKTKVIKLCIRRRERMSKKQNPDTHHPLGDFASVESRFLFNYSCIIVDNHSTDQLTLDNNPITITNNQLICGLCSYATPVSPEGAPNPTKAINQIFDHMCHLHLNAYQCTLCPRKFKKRKKFKQHLYEHRKPVQCDICLKPLARKDSLAGHKWYHKNAQEQANFIQKNGGKVPHYARQQSKYENPNASYFCAVCGKQFATRAYLLKHEKGHQTGNATKTICPQCGKSMTPKSYQTYHSKYACPLLASYKRFSCLQCSGTFQSKLSLARHVDRAHSQQALDRVFKCEQCSKGYKTAWDLKFHQKTHATEKLWKCPGCGKEFNVKRNLDRHKCRGTNTKLT